MIATVLVLAVGLLQQDWITYAPVGKGFRVEMPGRPDKTSHRTEAGPSGRALVTVEQLRTSEVTYMVEVVEAPVGIDPRTLDDRIRRFAAGLKAELGAIAPITVGARPGREFELSLGSGEARQRSKMRWVASGKMLVIISATGKPGGTLLADADRFLGSLEFGGARGTVAPRPRAETAGAGPAPKVKEAPAAEASPKAGAEATAKKTVMSKITISKVPRDARPYPEDDLQDLPRPFAATERDGFRDVGPAGSVLVGMRVTFVDKFGGPKIGSAQPVYRSGQSYFLGRTYGEASGPASTVVAGPGYAVGGLVTRTGLMVDGFGMVFMRVNGNHLSPGDTYNSPWIGDRQGGNPGEVTSPGGLVVGLQGRSRDVVIALGLTTLK